MLVDYTIHLWHPSVYWHIDTVNISSHFFTIHPHHRLKYRKIGGTKKLQRVYFLSHLTYFSLCSLFIM